MVYFICDVMAQLVCQANERASWVIQIKQSLVVLLRYKSTEPLNLYTRKSYFPDSQCPVLTLTFTRQSRLNLCLSRSSVDKNQRARTITLWLSDLVLANEGRINLLTWMQLILLRHWLQFLCQHIFVFPSGHWSFPIRYRLFKECTIQIRVYAISLWLSQL